MAKRTFTIVLDDDTQIKSLELNGNSFISSTELKAADIEGKLSKVTVKGSDGSVEEHGQMTLVQITQDGGKWWLCLRDLTDAEIQAAALKSQLTDANNAIAELTELIASISQ